MTAEARSVPPMFKAVLQPLQAFFQLEAAGGILLLVATVLALVWANSGWSESYQHLFHLPLTVGAGERAISFSLHDLVNEGLMTIFFFVVGLEIKRELAVGELRTMDRALLPALAAVGGMVAPAGIYVLLNWGTEAMRGWAIPMATDIAFAIGLVQALKARVPWGMIVFLTALAIFDDMGGIAVIAVFYGKGVSVLWLGLSAAIAAGAALGGRWRLKSGFFYGGLLAALWYAMHHAGIHATLAGVALGLAVPARGRVSGTTVLEELRRYLAELGARKSDEDVTNEEILRIEERLEDLEPPLNRFIHGLHGWVAFLIVPLFALANAGVDLRMVSLSDLAAPVPLGIALGLFVGKQVGVTLFTLLAVRLKWSPMPGGGVFLQLWGVSAVSGIGFTVALFVASLAFADSPQLLNQAKLGILVGSLVSAVAGVVILLLSPKVQPAAE